MKTSESLKTIGPALLKAQTLMGGATKGASNPYFKSKYADLGAVLEACKELLNTNGIVILQPHVTNEMGSFVETTLLHAESGEFVTSATKIVYAKEGDPQAQGSAITYARRYGLQSLLSIPAEDDDGNLGANKQPTKTYTTAATKTSSTLGSGSITSATPAVNETLTNVTKAAPPTTPTAVTNATPKSSFRTATAAKASQAAATITAPAVKSTSNADWN